MRRFQNNNSFAYVFFFFRTMYFGEGHHHYHINLNTLNTFIHSFIYIDCDAKRHTRLSANFWFLFLFLFWYLSLQPQHFKNQSHHDIAVLDSSGNPESGFVLGQSFWLGSIKGCEAVQNPHTLTLSNRFERMMHANLQKARAPFDIGYRVVYAAHTSPWQIQVEFLLDAAVSCWHDSFDIISPHFVSKFIYKLFALSFCTKTTDTHTENSPHRSVFADIV